MVRPNWISIVCLVTSSLTAAPLDPRRRSLARFGFSKSVAASRASETVAKAYDTSRTVEASSSSLHTMALPNPESTKLLPEKSTSALELQSSSLLIPGEDHVLPSQSPSSQNSKHNAITETNNIQAKVLTPSESQKAARQNPEIVEPEPLEKVKRVRPDHSGAVLKKKNWLSLIWVRIKKKTNNLGIIYFLKAIMQRVKIYSPQRYVSKGSVAQFASDRPKALEVTHPSIAPHEEKVIRTENHSLELAETHGTGKNSVKETEPSRAPLLFPWNLQDVPYNIYNKFMDTIRTRPPLSSAPESTSETLVKATKPSNSESTSPASASTRLVDKPPSSESLGAESRNPSQLSKEPLSSDPADKKKIAQDELKRLVYELLQPMVARYLTPEKTSRIVDKSLGKHGYIRWAASWVPKEISHNFIRDKIAPPFVKGLASWAANTIVKLSPDHIFELLERHSIEFLTTVNNISPQHTPHPG